MTSKLSSVLWTLGLSILPIIACAGSVAGGGDTNCQTVPCGTSSYKVCTGTGTCPSVSYSVGSQTFTCNSCDGSCSGAATSVASACEGIHTTGPEGGSGTTTCSAAIPCGSSNSYEICTTIASVSCTSVTYRFAKGTSYTCASCTDCSAAAASAGKECGGVTILPDGGGPDGEEFESGPGETDSGTDSGSDFDTGGGTDTGTCGKVPTLHPETAAGVYCPFSGVDGGANLTCSAGQICCETPESAGVPSTCIAGGPCPVSMSTSWECDSPVDCEASSAGPVCCGTAVVNVATGCGYDFLTSFTGTQCATSCGAGQFTVCESNSDCGGGTCTPTKAQGSDIGNCAP
jgi:hypothetical protein